MKGKIAQFLDRELGLELSMEKTLITNAGSEKAQFLGTELQRVSSVNGEIKRFRNMKGHLQRISTAAMIMNAPIKKIIERLKDKGIIEIRNQKRTRTTLNPLPILK